MASVGSESGSMHRIGGRDPRVDKAISWALTTAATLAMSAAAWQFSVLASRVDAMGAKLEGISIKIAVVEAARYGERLDRLEERLRALEARPR